MFFVFIFWFLKRNQAFIEVELLDKIKKEQIKEENLGYKHLNREREKGVGILEEEGGKERDRGGRSETFRVHAHFL